MQKIAGYFDKLWNWIVYSSANPAQISTTVKFGFGAVGVLITIVFGIGNIHYPSDQLTALIDPTIQAVQEILLGLTGLGTVIGALRKIWLTVKKPTPPNP